MNCYEVFYGRAEGFGFKYFHLESCGISVALWFTVILIWFCKVFVGLALMVWKCFLVMKLCIFML